MKGKPKLKTAAPSMYANVGAEAKVSDKRMSKQLRSEGQTDVCTHILLLGREPQVTA